MIQNILSQIENINKSLDWIKKNKSEDYERKFLQLVEERRKLRNLSLAAQDNPAIAAYGVSQVGKSYLMNCMLQKNGTPFLIEADGTEYNFIEEMNPKTKNTEATGVVTRFSSFKRDAQKYSKEYPILMRCLSVSDIILILCEGYYNDIGDFTTLSEDEIDQLSNEILEKYRNMPIQSSVILPDDILKIKAYFIKHLNNAQVFRHKASFFDKLAFVVEHIPPSQWVDVFSILWNRSEYQTRLFVKMLHTLANFHYSEYVYLPAQALLHNGINEDTIMSVQCLNELFIDSPKYFTDVYIKKGDGSFIKVEHIAKSEVCAVCAEVIVKIGDKYLNNSNHYCFDNITDSRVASKLTTGEVEMSLLNDNDMLDFPGARSRKKELLRTLKGDDILINVLLRGKVAYLFNMYNESFLINVLLYCHHGEKNEVTDVPHLLNDWIRNYVGDTIEKRRRTLELTGNISPLFYIGTKFNMDMEYSTEPIANGINALLGRWHQRFYKTLYQECFNADGSLDKDDMKIFLNWTRPGECFKNSYVLRDYKYSGPLASKLYDKEKTLEKTMLIPRNYYDDLRTTFCNSEYVKQFFDNPELSWDVAASIDNDGSLYIIEQLSKVASKMFITREDQFRNRLSESVNRVYKVMESYHVSTDTDEILEDNITKVCAILREMDFTCNTDNYYFGHLLQALQFTEAASYNVIHQVMQSPEINGRVNDFNDYELIRNSCKNAGYSIDDNESASEKWQCLMNTYRFSTREEAEEFLLRKNVNPEKLFTGSYKRKINSCIIADAVFDKWNNSIRSVEFFNEFTDDNGFDSTIMGNLVEDIILTAESINLRDILAKSIAEYVNVVNIHTANEQLLADILASQINEFVVNFGYSYLSDEEIENAKVICQRRSLLAFNYINKELPAVFEEADLTTLFNQMSNSPQALLPSFEDNFNKWKEYMIISFIAHLNVPDFDRDANQALTELLHQIKPN